MTQRSGHALVLFVQWGKNVFIQEARVLFIFSIRKVGGNSYCCATLTVKNPGNGCVARLEIFYLTSAVVTNCAFLNQENSGGKKSE